MSCPTLVMPWMQGSFVHAILQARILEWVAISLSRGSSQPRDRTCISYELFILYWGIPNKGLLCWLRGKEYTRNAGDTRHTGLIPGSGRSPGGGNGYPRQYFYLENSMNRGAWWAAVHGVTKSHTRLSN